MPTNTQQGGCKILWAQSTIDFASTAAQTSTDSAAVTITGAALGDPVILGTDTVPAANTQYAGFVSAADAVKVRFSNATAAAIDPVSQLFTIGVVKLIAV